MFFASPLLSQNERVSHGFFKRGGGQSEGIYASLNTGYGSGDDVALVARNREIIADTMQITPENLCGVFQVHSPNVVTADKPWHWKESPEADALVTNVPGIGLGILTADCLPILLADAEAGVIGAAHAGWKGASGGVIENTLAAMEKLGASKGNIHAAIGPAIAQISYEVGPEFYQQFLVQSVDNKKYFIPSLRDNHYLFDLKGYAKDRLVRNGVMSINTLANDTCCEENDFFSYRRSCHRDEKAYGRQMSVIVLQK